MTEGHPYAPKTEKKGISKWRRFKDTASMTVIPEQAIGLCDSFVEDLFMELAPGTPVTICNVCKKNTKYRFFGMCRSCAE
tara:strand:+ start:1084 stop:1323 length:240 start_codon:yes stop_codon:yes gene_type:complete